MRSRLTDAAVKRRAPEVHGFLEIWDTVVPGFGVRIWKSSRQPGGAARSYFIMYRTPAGKQKRYTIGSAHQLALSKARQIARDRFAEIGQGSDPNVEKQKHREIAPDSFGAVADIFVRRYAKRHHKHWQKTARMIDRELSGWKDRKLSDIARLDVLRALDNLLDQDKDYAANRLFEVIRKLFSWAIERGYIEVSPAAGIRAPGKECKRDRILTDDEIKVLWPVFKGAAYPFGSLFQMLLITGQRLSEVTEATWPEFDLNRQVWTIPSERYKTDRTHEVPLSDLALEILEELPRFANTSYLFTSGRTGRPVSGYSKTKARIDQQCDISAWRLHDLRRTLRTGLGRLGVPPHVAELVIGHSQKGLHAVYDRYTYQTEKAEALQKWADHLSITVGNKGG